MKIKALVSYFMLWEFRGEMCTFNAGEINSHILDCFLFICSWSWRTSSGAAKREFLWTAQRWGFRSVFSLTSTESCLPVQLQYSLNVYRNQRRKESVWTQHCRPTSLERRETTSCSIRSSAGKKTQQWFHPATVHVYIFYIIFKYICRMTSQLSGGCPHCTF